MADVLTVQPDRVRVGLQLLGNRSALQAAREVAGKVASVSDSVIRPRSNGTLRLRGLTPNRRALNTATMSVLDGDDETRHIERKVLGFVTA